VVSSNRSKQHNPGAIAAPDDEASHGLQEPLQRDISNLHHRPYAW
jgi:hypothetical protein